MMDQQSPNETGKSSADRSIPAIAEGCEPLVEVRRGELTECVHFGHFVVANASGEILDGCGNNNAVTFPRSSLKLIQTIGLIESGAAEHFRLEDRHVAIACASHRGEAFQVDAVSEWLKRIDIPANNLACGPDLPRDPASMHAILAAGGHAQSIYHNCSGKHAGYLTVCRHAGFDPVGYDSLDHPSQALYLENLSAMTGKDAQQFVWGIDGCTLPSPALSMLDMAVAMARMAVTDRLSASKQAAIERLLGSITTAPGYLSGTGQLATEICIATKGRVICKPGADGFYVAVVRDRGVGVALKILDGSAPAKAVAILAILLRIGALTADEAETLAKFQSPIVRDSAGHDVGVVSSLIS